MNTRQRRVLWTTMMSVSLGWVVFVGTMTLAGAIAWEEQKPPEPSLIERIWGVGDSDEIESFSDDDPSQGSEEEVERELVWKGGARAVWIFVLIGVMPGAVGVGAGLFVRAGGEER